MNNQTNLRHERRRAARSMTLLAFSGIFGVLAVAAVAVWFNWPVNSLANITDIDPMSMIG